MAGKTTDIAGIEAGIAKALAGFPALKVALLFGSAAAGRMTSASDVDVAVAADRPLPINDRFSVQAALSRELKREVDVVDLHKVSGVILAEAMTKGKAVLKDRDVYAALIRKMWYNQADMMPLVRMILERRRRRMADGR